VDVIADTGILLRLMEPLDPSLPAIQQAVDAIRARGDRVVIASQNVAEFWNVCTRAATARGGYGLTLPETNRRVVIIEAAFPVLIESPASYSEWRALVVTHSLLGKQVHDARLVALMQANGVTHILTLNGSDFSRYPGITVIETVPAAMPPPPSP
jgi:predicted nucleic acid-binding protein